MSIANAIRLILKLSEIAGRNFCQTVGIVVDKLIWCQGKDWMKRVREEGEKSDEDSGEGEAESRPRKRRQLELAAKAEAAPLVQGYCCVNPLLGSCVPRMIHPASLRNPGSRLGCALTRQACEKSCVLPGETLKNVAAYVGYGNQSLPNLQKSMSTTEAKSSYGVYLAKKDTDIDQFVGLLKIVKSSSGSTKHNTANDQLKLIESVSAFKKLIILFKRDAASTGKNFSYDEDFCLYVVQELFHELVFMYDETSGTKLPFVRTLLNDMFRAGRIKLHGERFQKILWQKVLEAVQVWMYFNVSGLLEDPDDDENPFPTAIGLDALLELAGIEPKISTGVWQWSRENLAKYLIDVGHYYWTRHGQRELSDFEREFEYSDLGITMLIPTIQTRLSKYKIEAIYRWILDLTFWRIQIDHVERQDPNMKLAPFSYEGSYMPFCGDLNDPWWFNAVSDRFKRIWPEQDTKITDMIIDKMIEKARFARSAHNHEQNLSDRKAAVNLDLKYGLIDRLLTDLGFPDLTEVTKKLGRKQILGLKFTIEEFVAFLIKLRYAGTLEYALKLFKEAKENAAAIQIVAPAPTPAAAPPVIRSLFGRAVIPPVIMQLRANRATTNPSPLAPLPPARVALPAAATFFVPQPSGMDFKSGGMWQYCPVGRPYVRLPIGRNAGSGLPSRGINRTYRSFWLHPAGNSFNEIVVVRAPNYPLRAYHRR